MEKEFSNIDSRFLFVNTGFNFRPTELQGAFGIHQIEKLERLVKLRISNAKYWNSELKKFKKFLNLAKILKQSFLIYLNLFET